MKIQDFLKAVTAPTRTNFFVLCPDNLGLGSLLNMALSTIAPQEDIHFFDAAAVTKEKARQIEQEARFAPRGGAKLNHFFLYGLQDLNAESVGPLLKAVEEAAYSRFIFQAQELPRKIHTLKSRGVYVALPFLGKKVVLANLKSMNHDARTADQLGLYDGTLSGTIKALNMKDSIATIQRETKKGQTGLVNLFSPDNLNSNAFDMATAEHLNSEEREFLKRSKTPNRQKIALFAASGRTA